MRFISDASRFKDLAAGFQSVALVIAVLVGGAWTAWTFYWNVQDRDGEAKARIEQSLREAEQQRNLKLSMAVTSLPVSGAGRYVKIRIDAQHSGSRPLVLDFSCDPVRVMSVDGLSGDRPTYRTIQRLRPLTHSAVPTSRPEPTNYPSSTLRAGGLQSYHFLTRLPEAGVYWITFSAREKVGGKPRCPSLNAKPQPEPQSSSSERESDGNATARWATGSFYVAR